jgi:hypothetical protein
MDERGYELMRAMIAEIEGAPFPNSIDSELYLIWYEHVQRAAQEALEYLAERGQLGSEGKGEQPELDV